MSNIPIRIAISGVGGRMGQQLIHAVAQSEQAVLGAALSRKDSKLCGIDVGELANIGDLGIIISDDLAAVKEDFDVLIDFTRPDASLTYLDFCRQHHKGIVIGTTGFNDLQKKTIYTAAQETGVVFAVNFSISVNLMFKLLEKAAKILGEGVDIEIIEAHHRNKADVPSGTALAMGEKIASILGRNFSDCAVYSREGYTGKRKTKSIGFSAVRAGDIVGEHTAMFVGCGESLEITHKASSRITFVKGAIDAAVWISRQKRGLFDMLDVLNLNKL